MFQVIANSPNRLDIELRGKLDRDAMRQLLDELIEKSQNITHGRMRYRIEDFDLPTLGAIGVELSRLPALFRLIRHFDRVAVLADKQWLRRAGEIEGALFPGLDIKAFTPEQEAEAEAWLAS